MNFDGARMNAAVLPLLRATPETGHFGWDWLNDGRRWNFRAFGRLCETRSVRRPEDNPNRRRQAISIDA
jgi:hypothetical protein